MREIKFRIWDHKKMVEVEDIDLSHEMLTFCHIEHEDIFSFDHLMQYTGIKDKNNIEVYEGDIVDTIDHLGGKRKLVVKFESCSFLCKYETSMGTAYQPVCGFKEVEVIGNIYENSELLKEGEMAIICSVCKRKLGRGRSKCCGADIIKYEGEELGDLYYRCSECGCVIPGMLVKESDK